MNKEHRTSNLVADLRNPPPWKPLNPQREALALRAADEIERLDRGHRATHKLLLERDREVERLTADYEKCRIYYESVKVERDRLRAALAGMVEAVRDVEIDPAEWKESVAARLNRAYDVLGMTAPQIAALAGAADETSAGRTKRGPWKTDDNGEPL